ncbi:tail fiber assembly protein [Serratia marcescens]|uniref:tail fiber assembly protein n=1 Tax=Serratia marcescens TaxID=615 RepID=UPI001495AEA7|nr:tail fiber assembly protein [Serratia marcescens]MDP8607172.1 tail fiber assembly protein [Serratia marcescens]MDP8875800.1 tail fiber assembly protein [Serratia marcescens]
MKHLKNLKKYIPAEPALGRTVSYLCDEDGRDWYESQKDFSNDTIKVVYDADGIILSVASDVSMLWPINLSVVEVSVQNAPKGLSDSGEWVFNGSAIVPRVYSTEEIQSQTEQKKTRLIDEAYAAMKPLELAVKHDMATDEEKAQLDAWERYSVMLSRINPEMKVADINWPEVPETT